MSLRERFSDWRPGFVVLTKGYDPAQPRHPAGSPEGGRWTSGTGVTFEFEPAQIGQLTGKPLREGIPQYHGTATLVAEKIMQEGLKRGESKLGREPSIYFTTDQDVARHYGWWSHNGKTFAVVDFDLDEQQLEAAKYDEEEKRSSYRLEADISPDRVRAVRIYDAKTKEMLDIKFNPGYHGRKSLAGRRLFAPVACVGAEKGYNPSQPRHPAGSPEGGQWASYRMQLIDAIDEDHKRAVELHRLIAEEEGYAIATTRAAARAKAASLGAPVVISTAREAAAAIPAALEGQLPLLEKNNPGKYARWVEDAPDAAEIEANWLKQFRSRGYKGDTAAFTNLNQARELAVQNAINANAENPLFSEVVSKGPPLVVIFQRAEKGQGQNGEYRAGTIRMYDQWADDVISRDTGVGSAVIGGGIAGVLRHEYGHALYDTKLTDAQRGEWRSLFHQNQEQIKTTVSGYAATNPEEFFSEVFALRTHEEYDPGACDAFCQMACEKVMDWVK